MNERETTIRGWQGAGEDFLAENLKKIFSVIESPKEVALHNDMVRDIQTMIGGGGGEFRKGVARILFSKPRNFLRGVAALIIQFSLRTKNDGKTKERRGN